MDLPIAEVISSTITGFVAESRRDRSAPDGMPRSRRPSFGSFVRAYSEDDDLDIYAVVYNVITGPQDNMHKPAALGMTREELKLQQPHIFALLKTEVQAVSIGYSREEKFFQHLPPQPPQVHDFVYACVPKEARQATENLDFLQLIASVSAVPSVELIAAVIRHAYEARDADKQFLHEAGQYLSTIYRDDYDRLLSALRKIRPADDC